jgi:hypothetical protein
MKLRCCQYVMVAVTSSWAIDAFCAANLSLERFKGDRPSARCGGLKDGRLSFTEGSENHVMVSMLQEHVSQQRKEYEEKLAAEVGLRESTSAEAQAAIAKLEKELQEARDALATQQTARGGVPDTLTVATYRQAG